MKNHHRLLSMGLVTLPLILASQSAQAASIVASHDNFVLNSDANNVQGESGARDVLVVKDATNNIRKSWLKFDLTGQNVDFSQSGTVTLTLAGSPSANFNLSLYALDYTGVTAPTWTESTLTWNNAPGNDTGGPGIRELESDETTLLGTTSLITSGTAAGSSYQFNISDLSTFLQSDNTITVIAISDQSNTSPSFTFASSEHATEAWRPTLTFTQIPEPSAAALILVSGFVGGALRRRRR